MADNPIDLKKIFNFDDTTPLDQVIAKAQQFNTVLETMLQTAQKSASGITASIQAITGSIDAMEKEIVSADATTKKGQETILKGIDQTSKATAQNEEYKKSLTDLNTTIKMLQEQIDKLNESNAKGPKQNEAQAGSLTDLKAKLKEATDAYLKMGDAVDASVKADALKRLTELNKGVQDGAKIINDAKKAVDTANGSYNDLAKKVADATKQLKAMEGGVGSNSEQFKSLQKFIKDGSDQLKAFDAAIGNHQREVGNYEKATEGLKTQFEGLIGQLGPAGEKIEEVASKTLKAWDLIKGMTTGVVGLTAAAGALIATSLSAYFTRTAQGALDLFVVTTELEYATIKAKNAFAALGGFLVDAVKNSLEYKEALILIQLLEGKGAKEFRDNALEGRKLQKERILLTIEESEEELEKNKLIFESRDKLHKTAEQRLEDAKKALELQKEISAAAAAQSEAEAKNRIFSIVKESGRNVNPNTDLDDAKAVAELIRGLPKNAAQEVAELITKINEAKNAAFTGTRRLQAEIIQISEELYKREVELAKDNLEAQTGINNDLLQAEIAKNNAILNNTRSTEDQKKQALLKNSIDEIKIEKNNTQLLIAEITQRAKDRIRLQMGQANFDAKSPAEQQAIIQSDATLQQQLLKLQQDYANKVLQINLNKQKGVLDITNQFTQKIIDNAALLYNHEKDNATAIANGVIDANNRILKNEDSTFEQRLAALQDNSKQQLLIAQNTRDKENKAHEVEAQKKILVDNDYKTHYIDMYAQIDKTNQDYENSVKKIDADTKALVRENIFTILARDLQVLDDKLKTLTNEQLTQLNKEFTDGVVSINKYEKDKNKIIRESNIERYTEELNQLRAAKIHLIATHTDTEKNITEIERRESELRKGISDEEAKFKEAKEKQIYNLKKELANKFIDSVINISKNENDARIQALDDQLSAIQENADAQLALAGDNQAAKDQINKRAKEQEAQIKKEEKKLRHDEAEFEKRLNEAKIIMNTAVAVSENLWNPVAAALIGALGALELAVVETTPIPAYFTGTNFSKEGPAFVAEHGPELAIDPYGGITLFKEKQIAYLNEGTKILNAGETEPLLKKIDSKHLDLLNHQLIDIGIRDLQSSANINREILSKLDALNDTTKKNKPAQINYARVGAMVFEFKKEEETYVKRTKALSMGSWMQ